MWHSVGFKSGINFEALLQRMSGSVPTNPVVMEMHVSEPKPSGLECKRILTFVIMAVALMSFIALICAQGRLEHQLTTGSGSPLTGLLLPFRLAAGGAVANVVYFVTQGVPASYCITLSPCVEQVKEICSGLTATFLGSMSILGVWVRVESVPYVARRFTPTAKHYRVSGLTFDHLNDSSRLKGTSRSGRLSITCKRETSAAAPTTQVSG